MNFWFLVWRGHRKLRFGTIVRHISELARWLLCVWHCWCHFSGYIREYSALIWGNWAATISYFNEYFQAVFAYNSPNVHPFISDDEKAYLKREIGSLERNKNIKNVPWASILTSVPVFALLLAHVCLNSRNHLSIKYLYQSFACFQVVGDWAYYVILINLPRYMNDVLHVSIEDNGFYSSIPWAMYILVIVSSGTVSDKLISKGRLTITRSRKIFTAIGKRTYLIRLMVHFISTDVSVLPGAAVDIIFLLLAMYSGCNVALVGFSFAMSVGALGALASALLINPMDLSPNFAGTIFGILGTFSDLMGVIAPIAASVLAPNVSCNTSESAPHQSPFTHNIFLFSVVAVRMARCILHNGDRSRCANSRVSRLWLRHCAAVERTTAKYQHG